MTILLSAIFCVRTLQYKKSRRDGITLIVSCGRHPCHIIQPGITMKYIKRYHDYCSRSYWTEAIAPWLISVTLFWRHSTNIGTIRGLLPDDTKTLLEALPTHKDERCSLILEKAIVQKAPMTSIRNMRSKIAIWALLPYMPGPMS